MGKEAPGHAHDISGLNVVFAITSIALFITTVWMIWHDYSREWKGYQRTFSKLERETTRSQFDEAQAALDQDKLQALEEELQAANDALFRNKEGVDELEAKRKEMADERYLVDITERELKSVYDSKKFYYEEGEHAPAGKGVSQGEFEALKDEFLTARRKTDRLGLRARDRGQRAP